MNDDEFIGTALKPSDTLRQHGDATYSKVFDQRKRRVRGLWERLGTPWRLLRLAVNKRVAHGIGLFFEPLVSQRADWWRYAHHRAR